MHTCRQNVYLFSHDESSSWCIYYVCYFQYGLNKSLMLSIQYACCTVLWDISITEGSVKCNSSACKCGGIFFT